MSQYSAIEICHDDLPRLMEEPERIHHLFRLLSQGVGRSIRENEIPGVRFMGTRYHGQQRHYECGPNERGATGR